MALPAEIQQQPASREAPNVAAKPDGLQRLAALHAEAAETARLANLLGRAGYVAAAIAAFALAGAAVLATLTDAATLTWMLLCFAGAAVLGIATLRTLRAPFERLALLSFREDMKAVLLYAGFAWGAGGWLMLPYDASAAAVIAFAALPVGAIAALVKDRDCAFLFGAPITALVAFASVLRPFSDAALDAAFVLIACGAVGAAAVAAERLSASAISLPFFKQIKA
jgi:hypothetical protein